MRTATLTVERSGFAVVQDLGRPGYAAIGIAANGAGDRRAARTASTLVGNADDAPVIEVVGSNLDLLTDSALVMAVCGAVDGLLVNGHRCPTWETLLVPAGARIQLPAPRVGQRSYLAANGTFEAEKALGSVAPDPLLDVGRRLLGGGQLVLTTSYEADGLVGPLPVFRLGARPSRPRASVDVRATPGPDLERLALGGAALAGWFEVLPHSDNVGVRLTGGSLALTARAEILSRGVPVGAVEVPPSGELIILMRGRLVTAGYPVVAVLTTSSVDLLAQTGPGDRVRLSLVDLAAARTEIIAQEAEHRALADRVARAFAARGGSHLLSANHASVQSAFARRAAEGTS